MKTFSLQWHITNNCDQRCKHCYIFNSNEKYNEQVELIFEDEIRVLDDFEKFCEKINVKPNLVITGGDPILKNTFWKLLENIKQRNIQFSIIGNPFHLTDDVCIKLYDLGCRSYQMSIDGMEEKHDFIRKSGSFNTTIDKINVLQRNGIRCNIMMTISKFNQDDIIPVIEKMVELEINNFAFARYVPQQNDADVMFSPEEYKKLLDNIWNVFEKHSNSKTTFSLKDHLWTLYLYEKNMFRVRTEDIIFEGCHCGIQGMSLLADGTVYACRRFESPIGNIKEGTFFDIFYGNKINKFRDYDKMECKKCNLFNYCRGCPAVSFGTYNDFYKKDPQCWKLL